MSLTLDTIAINSKTETNWNLVSCAVSSLHRSLPVSALWRRLRHHRQWREFRLHECSITMVAARQRVLRVFGGCCSIQQQAGRRGDFMTS